MLVVKDLHFSAGRTPILNGVSFRVSQGEKLGIIGPNGSGKTTLFNCLSGFNVPSSGAILLGNTDVTQLPPHRKAALGLGRVFQNFGIFKEMTVQENIVTALEGTQRGLNLPFSRAMKRNIEEAQVYLEMVRLERKATEKAGSLSGGQMRLLEIARAIASRAELFLLDEPTAGVSPKMKGEVEAVLHKLSELRKTVLIIEHDLNFIQRLCERIIVLDIGRVVLDDTPENVRQSKLLHEIYFGSSEGGVVDVRAAVGR